MVRRTRFCLCVVLLAGVSNIAYAQVDNAGVLDQALRRFRDAAQSWQDAAHSAATSLFWSLATISLVWTIGQLAVRRAELGEFFGELMRYLLFTGFWAWMLENGPLHARMIMDSMVKIGGSAAGTTLKSPSGVLDVGFRLLDRALEQSSLQSPIETSIGVVMALGILVILALVGVNMLVAMISCWIVAYGGLIVLGFGGSKWTSDMASNYYRMILSLGLQVLAMVLLVGVGEGLLRDYFDRLEQTVNVRELAVMMVIAIVLLLTVNRVPALLGTLASGSSPQYAMGAGAGAGAALSTLSATSAMAAMATRPVIDGAQQFALAAAAGFATGGPGAAAALADSFRSGGSQEGAGSGSVFSPPSAAGALPASNSGGSFGSFASSSPTAGTASTQGGTHASDNARASNDAVAGQGEPRPPEREQYPESEEAVGTADASAEGNASVDNTRTPQVPPSGSGSARGGEPNGSTNDAARGVAAREGANESSRTAPSPPATSSATESGAIAKNGVTGSNTAGAGALGDSHEKARGGASPSGSAEQTASTQGPEPTARGATSQATPPPLSATSIAPIPMGSIASATQMQIQSGSDDRFQHMAPPPPPLGAFQASRRDEAAAPPALSSAPVRSELAASSLMHRSVDIEAEVAAFRDQEG